MELLIIRHGQSEADLLDVHEGRADYPLTQLGEYQAKQLAQYLEVELRPDMIVTSPLKRAKRTAMLLQEQIGCELVVEEELMEFNNGVLAGLSRKEAALKYPLPKGGRPIHVPIQKGESELDFRFRAEKIYHKIVTDYQQYRRIAIISHEGLISNLLKLLLNLPNSSETVFATGDTGFHLVNLNENRRIIRCLNKQDHLLKME